jgi:putative MATE family efflux protein
MSHTISDHPLLGAPIGKTMFALAAPNSIAMFISMMTVSVEAYYVGLHGVVPLAGLALVFPLYIMMNTLSAGAIGGAISGLMARYAGGGNREGAEAIAFHAMIVAAIISLFFSALFLLGGHAIFTILGAREDVMAQALSYSNICFAGIATIWFSNTLGAIMRGLGEMKTNAVWTIFGSAVQVVLCIVLISGLGPIEAMGIRGAAWSAIIAFGMSAIGQALHLMRPHRDIRLRLNGIRMQSQYFREIISIGLTASVASVCLIGTNIIVSGFAARLGPETLAGFGIGLRLEFIMIPLVFGIGAACINMIGVHYGAGQIDRAHRIGWTGGIAATILSGGIGLFFAAFPVLLSDLFTDNQAAQEAAQLYLRLVAPFYAFLGLGLCMYFASQGTGRVVWAAIGNISRLVLVLVAGMLLIRFDAFTAENLCWVIAGGLVIYGTVIAGSVKLGAWRTGLSE